MESSAIRAYEILKRHDFSAEEAEIIIASKDESLAKWVASKEDLVSVKLELREDIHAVKISLITWFIVTALTITGVFSSIVFAIVRLAIKGG
jgi:hypothetical protein